MFSAAEQMKQQSQRASRLVRATVLAVHVVGQEQCLDRVRLVVAFQKFTQAAGEERNQLGDLATGNSTKTLTHPQQIRPTLNAAGTDLRRRLQKKRLQVASQLLKPVIHADKCFGVSWGELAELCHGPVPVRPPGHHSPVGEGNLDRRIAGHHAQPMFRQIEVFDHLRPQHAGNIRSGRRAATGGNLFGYATPADNFPALQDQRAEPGSGQIGCGCEPIVTATYHDGVIHFVRIEPHIQL